MIVHMGTSATRNKLILAAVIISAALFSVPVFAAEPPKVDEGQVTFLKKNIKAHSGNYIVTQGVNVRSQPKSNSKKVGKLKGGEKIESVGVVKGPWIAVRKDGKDLGYTFGKFLIPVIDGTLSETLTGVISSSSGWTCRYKGDFTGKFPVEDKPYEISDYEVSWDCERGDKKMSFLTPMFMTEVPYNLGFRGVFQVTIDIVDFDDIGEDVMSTNLFYNGDKGRVVYDGVSNDKYGKKPEPESIPTPTIKDAIKTSIEMAFHVWTDSLWTDLKKLH